jgi:uncharacterized protein (DUF433 family)
MEAKRDTMIEIAPRITVDDKVRFGKPVIKGTRVPVDLVIAKLGAGMSMEELEENYDLTREDVLAALTYAAHAISEERVRASGE